MCLTTLLTAQTLLLANFTPFSIMKYFLGGQRFNDNDELKPHGNHMVLTHVQTSFEEGIEKLMSWFDKCLEKYRSCVEK